MAGIYNGHILEFPQIRVDCFTTPTTARPHMIPSDPSSSTSPWTRAPNARLYLLTHVHTDHLVGLSNAFTGTIVCSPDTKRMLLRLEPEMERERLDSGVRERKMLMYDGLRRRIVGEGKAQRVIDSIEVLQYGETKEYELGYENGEPLKVSITLLDANHCPGSSMFLIRSQNKAVLHTGDVRADKAFTQSLRTNTILTEYVDSPTACPFPPAGPSWGNRILDRIYLDTSAVLGTGDMPDRGPVLAELMEQMSMYPADTVFFLNVWCFGWEHVVKAVASHFRCPVHVDRYKRSIYTAIETDPFLLGCTTLDSKVTRFHACERRFKCPDCRTFDKIGKRVWNQDKRVVHVNMVEVKATTWDVQQIAFRDKLGKAACGEGEWPYNIECPIARHSPLPELQSLVKVFRPRSVSPNCVVPMLQGLDYFLLPDFLKDHLQPEGYEAMISERDAWFQSSVCFIRDGADSLVALKKRQQLGTALLESTAPDGGIQYDDYLPDTQYVRDCKPMLGFARRHVASDQAMRAGRLFDISETAPGSSPVPREEPKPRTLHTDVGSVQSGQTLAVGHDTEAQIQLSDTDEEEHQQKRRRGTSGRFRRRHLLNPKTARSRVMLSQSRLLDDRMQREAETSSAVPALRKSHSRLSRNETNTPYGRSDKTPSELEKPLNLETRFRVEGRHLAALMAAGASPPSSP